MKKTTKLTIETQRVIVIRRLTESCRVMCEACDEVVSFVTADEAAALARLSARAIYRLIEARKLHFIERAEGSSLICLNSLCNSSFAPEPDGLTKNIDWKGEDHGNQE